MERQILRQFARGGGGTTFVLLNSRAAGVSASHAYGHHAYTTAEMYLYKANNSRLNVQCFRERAINN